MVHTAACSTPSVPSQRDAAMTHPRWTWTCGPSQGSAPPRRFRRASPVQDELPSAVLITNTGRDRAAYTADIRITGPQGFEAVLHVGTDGVPIHPGTSHPAELTAADPGKPVPADPAITISHVSRVPYEG